MHALIEHVRQLLNARALVTWGGYPGLTLIIFAETGLFVGFFLPGDSLLVTAALLAATSGLFNVYLLALLLTVASVLGNTAAYAFGKATGPRLFAREDSLLFKKRHLQRAHKFYERHGGVTVIVARFMPIVRTFVPIVAGMAEMGYRRFTLYNILGGVSWIWSMLFIGYVLGRYIPGVDAHIEGVILTVILLSLSPGIIGWIRARSTQAKADIIPDA